MQKWKSRICNKFQINPNMSDKYKLLVNGDYGASDDSDSESVQPVSGTMKSISNNSNYSQKFVQSDTTTTQGK